MSAEAQAGTGGALLDDLLQPGEGTTADEQDVRGVDLDEVLVRVLAPALRRDVGARALQDLQQRLLDALARHVTGDRRAVGLARDLVDLVDVDDAGLGALDVPVGGLDQLEQDVFHVLAHIAGLGERGGVGDGERDVEHAGQRLRQVGLAGAGGPDQQDVALGNLDRLTRAAVRGLGLQALVVVVDRDGERLLGLVLADHIGVEELADLHRLGQLFPADLLLARELLFDDLVTEVDALVADVDTGTGDQLLDLALRLATEGAFQQITAVDPCHPPLPCARRRPSSHVPSLTLPAVEGFPPTRHAAALGSPSPGGSPVWVHHRPPIVARASDDTAAPPENCRAVPPNRD